MVDTPNLGITHLTTSQGSKEVTTNDGLDELDTSNNDPFDVAVGAGGSFTLAAGDFQQNSLFRATGSPASATTIKFPDASDARNRMVEVENDSTKDLTVDTVTGVSTTSTILLPPSGSTRIAARGRELTRIGRELGFIPLDIAALRRLTTNDIQVAPGGGILAIDTAPKLKRISTSTDKAMRVEWALAEVDEVQFPPVPMPPMLDAGVDMTIHLLADMDAATDTPVIDVQVFDAVGDTEMGGNTAALSSTLAELSVTVANANISGHPLGFLNISLIPAAHGTDALRLYAAWIEYTKA